MFSLSVENYGGCACDRIECGIARAVRKAAGLACINAIKLEYGSASDCEPFDLASFPAGQWVCRAFPRRSARPCPSCGYTPWILPEWVAPGKCFGFAGKCYRVVSVGSTNRYSNGFHFEDRVTAELLRGEKWRFPALPASINDVEAALKNLFQLPTFGRLDLEKVIVGE